MIGELVTNSAIMIFGYAYPAFQCFKTVEKNRVEIHELRFWCQYWIIIAVLTVLERIGDVFISWLPMYGEMKLALFIYLWYPKTQGTGFVYETFLRPYVSKHETDIERSLFEFRERAWNLAIYFWNNCTELGSDKIIQFLQFISSQSSTIRKPTTESVNNKKHKVDKSDKRGPSNSPPPTPSRMYPNPNQTSASEANLHNQTQFIRPEDSHINNAEGLLSAGEHSNIDDDVQSVRHRLSRFIAGN